jgi:hypothetical protein
MGLIEEINGLVIGQTNYESLASLLKTVMEKQLTEETAPKNYYYVTHVTNPVQTYFSRLNPDVKRPKEIIRKLARGKQLHSYANIWFKNLPDFYTDEALLDGAWVGIQGVRGKIDHRIGNSLVEFKTKESLPKSPEDIIFTYPNDLEQIAFYSVIHPSIPKINYLVFMRDSSPYEIKAFKIKIKEKGTIKSILISRINLLNKAFETEDPSKLGRCRYYGTGCQYHIHEVCSCSDLSPLNTDPLQRSVEITYDEEFTRKLIQARENSEKPDVFSLSIRDIIAPRQHFMEAIYGIESTYTDDEKGEFKAFLWTSLGSLKRDYNVDLNKTERQSIMQSLRDPRVRVGFRWLKLKSSIHPEGEIVPYIEKVNMKEDMKYTKPSQYHLAELGIICALYGVNKGLLIKLFPNMDNFVHVLQVTYKKPEEILSKVKSIIDTIEEAEKKEDLLSLPNCPSWMNDGGKCPLISDCNIKGGKGCR